MRCLLWHGRPHTPVRGTPGPEIAGTSGFGFAHPTKSGGREVTGSPHHIPVSCVVTLPTGSLFAFQRLHLNKKSSLPAKSAKSREHFAERLTNTNTVIAAPRYWTQANLPTEAMALCDSKPQEMSVGAPNPGGEVFLSCLSNAEVDV